MGLAHNSTKLCKFCPVYPETVDLNHWTPSSSIRSFSASPWHTRDLPWGFLGSKFEATFAPKHGLNCLVWRFLDDLFAHISVKKHGFYFKLDDLLKFVGPAWRSDRDQWLIPKVVDTLRNWRVWNWTWGESAISPDFLLMLGIIPIPFLWLVIC